MKMPNFTLGWELEATRRAWRVPAGVEVGHDGSVNGDGLEFKTRREIVSDPQASLQILRRLVSDPCIDVDPSCGFHVHMGLGRPFRRADVWAAHFANLARMVEHVAFQAVPESRRDNRFCRAWGDTAAPLLGKIYGPNKYDNPDRYYWANFVEMFRPTGIRTIEIRLLGNTKRYLYLLAWVSVCRMMAQAAWRLMDDPSRLMREAKTLEGHFIQIRNAFMQSPVAISPLVVSRVLARKAGLLPEPSRPLQDITLTERRVSNSLGAAPKSAILEVLAGCHFRFIEDDLPWMKYDIVWCRKVPVDGNAREGHFYIVSRDEATLPPGQIRIVGDNGSAWYVNKVDFRLVLRREEVPCAV